MQINDLDLRVIPLSETHIHEKTIPEKVDHLTEKIKLQNLLKNPVIMVEERDKFIVIDGNHRVEALRKLSARSVIAQIVNYSEVRVESWNRLVKTDIEKLQKIIPMKKDVSPGDCWVEYQGEIYDVGLEKRDVLEILEKLKNEFEIEYISGQNREFPVICYKPFSKKEIIESAIKKTPLPPKSTRHILRFRILGIRFPLKLLINEKPAKLNEYLKELLKKRQEEGSIRTYEEKVLMLDEFE